jgi:hypothetical protein
MLNAREVSADLYSIATTETPTLFLAWSNGDPQFLEVELPPANVDYPSSKVSNG